MKERLKEFSITCPKCKHSFKEELNTAVFDSSSEREEILAGDFAKLSCPICGKDFILNYRFVYTDNGLKYMIINDPDFCDIKNRIALRSSFKLLDKLRKNEAQKFNVILTTDIKDLREKIIILEDGLSIRAIELMKYMLLEADDLSLGHDDVVNFRFTSDKDFEIQTKGGDIMKLPFPREVYDRVYDQYKDYFEEKIELVDKAWAFDLLKNIRSHE